jgi:CBS domain-containing protein
MSVSHILGVKGRNVITGTATETVQSIAQKLAQHRIGAVVIVDDKEMIAGIVSERDIVRALAEHGAKSMAMPVSAIMSKTVRTCKTGDSEIDLMAMMTTHRIRHLPVVHQGEVIGVVSIGDLVKAVIEDQQVELDQLQRYIAS